MTTIQDLEENVRSAAGSLSFLRDQLQWHQLRNTPNDPIERRKALEELAMTEARYIAGYMKYERTKRELAEALAGPT